MKLSLGHIELFVSDPMASKAFYVDVLGCELVEVQGDRVVWLKLGAVELLLRPGGSSPAAASYQEAGSAIVLYVDDAKAALAELEARGLEVRGDDGGCPTFTDPDGHWFQLVNPADHS
jgi:catechol 2,3-dioxygenase-like lactoylglutathione lyase family enzyme